ncbi:GNAT family N-acetyltransferase [Methanosalsum zhilinae]|uniref:GNAT family N-acetyltransferase n=1 Tax=Methanosalsum zhilinae TaxID=39669 RepID=UPI000662BD35|nr:GNAT family N-acetyltransferase [Methanosalsum zhilinae]
MKNSSECSNSNQKLVIEKLSLESDRKKLKKLGRESFPYLHGIFLDTTPHTLLARYNGEIAGAIVMKLAEITPDENVGIISWLFTSGDVRGAGIGEKLVREGMEYLKSKNCSAIVTAVDGYNTSSSKIFANNGYVIQNGTTLINRYGFKGYLRVWTKLKYYSEIGHFLWVYGLPEPENSSGPITSWLANLTIISIAFVVSYGHIQELANLYYVILAGILFMSFRYIPLKILTMIKSEQWIYRGWHNGYLLSLIVAIIFGAFFPMPGAQYPENIKWSYRDKIQYLGTAYIVSSLLMVSTLGIVLAFPGLFSVGFIHSILFVGISFLIFDILLIMAPFQCYMGRRVYDFSRISWIGIAAIAIIVLFLFMTSYP